MSSQEAAVPRLPWDAVDPYPFYKQRRRDGDIVWDDTAQTWLVLGYHKAQQVLSRPGWTVDPLRKARDAISPGLFDQSMLNSDGAAHRRLRAATRDVFAPSFVTGLSVGVDAIAGALIDRARAGSEFDFMSEVAQPLPLAVIAEWLALDPESSKLLSQQTHQVIRLVRPLATADDLTAGTSASATLVAHLLPLAASRRADPGEDLLSFLVSDPDLLLDEAVVTAVNIAVGALENTADFLGSATVRLLRPDAHGARLIDQIDVADQGMITELLRLDSPQTITRTATEAQRIGDVDIPPGEQVLVVLAAANRDPAVFDDPDQFRPGRAGPAPLTFGHGQHFCIGATLARLEVAATLRRMRERDPALAGPVTWRDTPERRGPLRLPVVFRAPSEKEH
ncbi:MAG: cytochrome P450 [Mycolicibacterium sp.]|uniref:cytochrome P450 n=1 Tax=Mycolicibacterium sp. TaxID=2320850 RepID=UPI003D0FC3C7